MDISHDVLNSIDKSMQIHDTSTSFEGWKKNCTLIHHQLEEDILRIAVVGAIKSGKSTCINSLLNGDYLQRGAGVVTSVVTKICCGSLCKATIQFKSWEEINSEISQALHVLLTVLNRMDIRDPIDIRLKKDRDQLQAILSSLDTEQWIAKDTRNINSVLVSSYLKGYPIINNLSKYDDNSIEYHKDNFSEYRQLVTNENLAVYVKDIRIDIDSDTLESNIELADCQGSDSTNPLHILQVQDYLLKTHIVLYIISSRTGVRQADIKFLSMIKQMGMMSHIFFIINCDFNEHDTLDNLVHVIHTTQQELSLFKSDPSVYSFSSLYNLFHSRSDSLSSKEQKRYEQWQQESAFIQFSDEETKRFKQDLTHQLSHRRYHVLFKNAAQRLWTIVHGLDHWLTMHERIINQDTDSALQAIEGIKIQQRKMEQIKILIKNTLNGASETLKKELRVKLDRFFDHSSPTTLLFNLIQFIDQIHLDYTKYAFPIPVEFPNAMYLLYQEFKQSLDVFMAETINPQIVHFIKGIEALITENFTSIAQPFDTMVKDVILEFSNVITDQKIGLVLDLVEGTKVDINSAKQINKITLPAATAMIRYSAKIKTEAIMRLGFYKMLRWFRKYLNKNPQQPQQDVILALKDGMRRAKRETQKSLLFHIEDYKENIKFQYVFKLVDAVANRLYEDQVAQFQAFGSDLGKLTDCVMKRKQDKKMILNHIQSLQKQLNRLQHRLESIQQQIEGHAKITI